MPVLQRGVEEAEVRIYNKHRVTMDNKFLEEAREIVMRELSPDKKLTLDNITIAVNVAKHLSTLSSKHKDDVRALREAIKKPTVYWNEKRLPQDTEQRAVLEDERFQVKDEIIRAFDSTLKERGISL